MDQLTQRLKQALTDKDQQQQWIQRFTTQHLPNIVTKEIEQLIVLANKEDILRVKTFLSQLRLGGIAAIWAQIKDHLIETVRVQGGKLIPLAAIETAKTMPIDMQMFELLFVNEIIKLRDLAAAQGAESDDLASFDNIISVEVNAVLNRGHEEIAPLDDHSKLMQSLAPFQSQSTHVFFKSIQEKNYNQALRRVCTVNSEMATRMLSVLLEFKEVLSINVNEQAGPQQQTALHHLAKRQNQEGYDMLVAAGADESLKDSVGKVAKAYRLLDAADEIAANDEEVVASPLMRI